MFLDESWKPEQVRARPHCERDPQNIHSKAVHVVDHREVDDSLVPAYPVFGAMVSYLSEASR